MKNNDEPAPSPKQRSFLQCSSTWFVIAIRLLLLCQVVLWQTNDADHRSLSSSSSIGITSPAVCSIVENPIYTLDHVHEARALQRLFAKNNASRQQAVVVRFADAYRLPSHIHLPPLVLSTVQSISSLTQMDPKHSHSLEMILWGLLLLMLDLVLATSLERLGKLVLCGKVPSSKNISASEDDKGQTVQTNNNETTDNQESDWETLLEAETPEVIRAPLAHIFDLVPPPTNGNRPEEVSRDAGEAPFCIPTSTLPRLLATIYFASPVSILAGSRLRCFQNVPVFFLVQALVSAAHFAQEDEVSIVPAAVWLSLATYMEVDVVLFLLPLTILVRQRSAQLSLVLVFVSFSLGLQVLAMLLIPEQQDYAAIVIQTHLYSFLLTPAARWSPSLSTLWYFGMEIFQRFHVYFTFLLGGAPYILVLPLTIRLHRYPMVLVRL